MMVIDRCKISDKTLLRKVRGPNCAIGARDKRRPFLSLIGSHIGISALALAFLATVLTFTVQAQNPPSAQGGQRSETTQSVTVSADPARVAQLLNQTISWYRQVSAERQLVTNSNDAVFADSGEETAEEVVRLAFQFARSEASATPEEGGSSDNNGETSSQAQTLRQEEIKLQEQAQQVQAEVDGMKVKVAAATGSQRRTLQAQLDETQAEVDLARARVDAIRNVAQFVSSATHGSGGLSAQIDALGSTVPANLTAEPGISEKSPSATPQANTSANLTNGGGNGLWMAAKNLFGTWGKLRSIDSAAASTQALARNTQEIRDPMTGRLRSLSTNGDQLAQQADNANAALLGQETRQLDSLTRQFKQLASASAPIAKMTILLGLSEGNLASWRSSVKEDLITNARDFLLKLLVTVIILAVILSASELARRAVQRYVRDVRLRSQLHWMRKLVVWFAIGLLVVFSLVSQIGSVATFAGLLSAGLALALQNVIQSAVGYFFLIGKHGIRAGDRVQIGGVTGDVVDVGPVRIHIMEMGGAAADAPTGRIVAFSNSIVFQPGVGLFKQIPGTNFAWHEITLTLPGDTNFATARERLMKAVETGLADFKDEIARQHSAMEDTFEATGSGLKPTVQLQFSAGGLEAVVRYPVALRHATEIDDRVTREVLNDLDLTHAGASALKLKTSTSAA